MSVDSHVQVYYGLRADWLRRRDEWLGWHRANPAVWSQFQRFAMQAVKRGRKTSHWLVMNRIRWEVEIITTGSEFKINNEFIGFYARLWIDVYPEHAELFTIHRMIGEPAPYRGLFWDLA